MTGRGGRDRGSMSVEVVVLTPLLVAFVLLVVALGRYVFVEGEVQSASREAARSASLARDLPSAQAAATSAAHSVLGDPSRCDPVALTGAFTAGGTVHATVRCDVPMHALGLIGVAATVPVQATSGAPVDTLRRTG